VPVNVDDNTTKDMSTEEDLAILKSVNVSKVGRTGVGSRLRGRKGKETEIAAEAINSPKKKMVGPSRRPSKVDIPAKQKKQSSKRRPLV
jgi:hypothetical protein